MIVVALLLILVAVTLLVMGLAGGSSSLLIGSIVASLLAAVALVVGARQAATRRRATQAAGVPAAAEDDPFLSEGQSPAEFATAGARTSTGPGPAGTHTTQGARAADRSFRTASPQGDFPPPAGDDDFAPPPGAFPPPRAGDDFATPRGGFPPPGADDDFAPPPGPSGDFAPPARHLDDDPPPAAADLAYAGPDAADPAYVGDFPPPPPPSGSRADEFPPPPPPAFAAGADREPDSDFSGSDPILDDDDDLLEPEPSRAGGRAPDFDHASSVIGGARSEGNEAWRSDPTITDPGTRRAEDYDAFDDEPLLLDEPAGPAAEDDRAGTGHPGDPRGADDAAPEPMAAAGDDDEFAEADDDDPADEPLPQAVRPGDAVRVARMDAEVLVVDGRPRFHLSDCTHLVGRLTEGLPVSEAVELGFNPCGLCRPVDRLIARATSR